MLYNSTTNKLHKIKKEVDLIKDKLGMPVDELIKQAVIALRLWDFPTSGSCQGHNTITEYYKPSIYPWVDIDNELCNDHGREENDKHLDRFQDILSSYNSNPKVDYRSINIEYFGMFGAFRIYARSIEEMNSFVSYLINRYDFCSIPKQSASVMYIAEKELKDLLQWGKENEKM